MSGSLNSDQITRSQADEDEELARLLQLQFYIEEEEERERSAAVAAAAARQRAALPLLVFDYGRVPLASQLSPMSCQLLHACQHGETKALSLGQCRVADRNGSRIDCCNGCDVRLCCSRRGGRGERGALSGADDNDGHRGDRRRGAGAGRGRR